MIRQKLNFVVIVLMLLVFAACNDSPVLPTELGETSKTISPAEDVTYATKNLLTIGETTLALWNEEEFKTALYKEIEKAFDGEKNVLIKTLADPALTNERIAGAFHESLARAAGSEQEAAKTMKAFEQIEGRNYYPHIFIPFYDELKAAGKINKKEPVLVVAAEDVSQYPGYVIGSEGKLIEAGFMVTEDYAKEHEVWVLSINERVDSNGQVISLNQNSQSARTKGASYPDCQIYQMKVVTHKEEWAAGGSEVNMRRYKSFHSYTLYTDYPRADGLTSEDSPGDDGWRIREFSRSEVNNKSLVVFNWTIISDWPDQEIDIDNSTNTDFRQTPYLYYIVFEYDAWPTGLRNASLYDASGDSDNYIADQYRSADGYYAIGYLNTFSADGSNILQGGINAYIQF